MDDREQPVRGIAPGSDNKVLGSGVTTAMSHDDTVHFPPLERGEEVIAAWADSQGRIRAGEVYTVRCNCGQYKDGIDWIALEGVEGSYPETQFDRRRK